MLGITMLRELYNHLDGQGTQLWVDKYTKVNDFHEVIGFKVDLPIPHTANGDCHGSLVDRANREEFDGGWDFVSIRQTGIFDDKEAVVDVEEVKLEEDNPEYDAFLQCVFAMEEHPAVSDEAVLHVEWRVLKEWIKDEITWDRWLYDVIEMTGNGILEENGVPNIDKLCTELQYLRQESDYFHLGLLYDEVWDFIQSEGLSTYEHNSVWVNEKVLDGIFQPEALEDLVWFLQLMAPAFCVTPQELITTAPIGCFHEWDEQSLNWEIGLMQCSARCKYCGGVVELTTASRIDTKNTHVIINKNELMDNCKQQVLPY